MARKVHRAGSEISPQSTAGLPPLILQMTRALALRCWRYAIALLAKVDTSRTTPTARPTAGLWCIACAPRDGHTAAVARGPRGSSRSEGSAMTHRASESDRSWNPRLGDPRRRRRRRSLLFATGLAGRAWNHTRANGQPGTPQLPRLNNATQYCCSLLS